MAPISLLTSFLIAAASVPQVQGNPWHLPDTILGVLAMAGTIFFGALAGYFKVQSTKSSQTIQSLQEALRGAESSRDTATTNREIWESNVRGLHEQLKREQDAHEQAIVRQTAIATGAMEEAKKSAEAAAQWQARYEELIKQSVGPDIGASLLKAQEASTKQMHQAFLDHANIQQKEFEKRQNQLREDFEKRDNSHLKVLKELEREMHRGFSQITDRLELLSDPDGLYRALAEEAQKHEDATKTKTRSAKN